MQRADLQRMPTSLQFRMAYLGKSMMVHFTPTHGRRYIVHVARTALVEEWVHRWSAARALGGKTKQENVYDATNTCVGILLAIRRLRVMTRSLRRVIGVREVAFHRNARHL